MPLRRTSRWRPQRWTSDLRPPTSDLPVPHPRKSKFALEWLSDNGSAYIAKDTARTAAALGLRLAFTPVRSPQSNGMSEAFVKTLKRDYARNVMLTDAQTVLALLPAWFDDYNESHPHSGLRFLSPREFRAIAESA